MKTKYTLLFISLAIIVSACSKDTTAPETAGTDDPVFYGTIEDATKAALNTTTWKVEWQAADEIAIVDDLGTKVIYVATPDGENSAKATFTKKAGESNTLGSGPYTAYYPANISEGLPNVTVYYNDADSDLKSLPMAAQSETTSLVFKNLCSVIQLTLSAQTGYIFKSVTLSSESKYLSGAFTISGDKAVLSGGNHYSTLNRANAKNMSSEQVYYLPIPADTYEDLQIMVYNNAQGEQSFYLNKSKTFERNTIYPLTLDCTNFRINLSRDHSFDGAGSPDDRYLIRKTANCYQATAAAGKYKFLPTKGEGGEIVTGIKSVKVLWETNNSTSAPTVGAIVKSAVTYNKGCIEFDCGGSQGNALIAAYDGEDGTGNILWSWHIWRVNSAYGDEDYPSGAVMMNMNLGAINNTKATSQNPAGLIYQYGRKDPFPGRANFSNAEAAFAGTAFSRTEGPVDIASSIKSPSVFYYRTSGNSWSSEDSKATWDGENKTIYDPCPSGYRVPVSTAWNASGSSSLETFSYSGASSNYGFDFGSTSWYTMTGQRKPTDGTLTSASTAGTPGAFMWSREFNASGNPIILQLLSTSAFTLTGTNRCRGLAIRCQKITD